MSIIIPHKNATESVEKLLRSIESEISNSEVFVVDDNSEEKEQIILNEMIKRYNSWQNNFYFLLENKGEFAGGARNTALKLLTSEWVLFADADDYFVEGWYREVSNFYESQSDMIIFPPTSFNSSAQAIGKRHMPYERILHPSSLKKRNGMEQVRMCMYPPWSKMIKVDLLHENKILFDEVLASNDILFSIKAGLKAKEIEVCENTIYCVTEGENTLVSTPSVEKLKSRIEVCKRVNEFLKENYPNYFKKYQFSAWGWYKVAVDENFTFTEKKELLEKITEVNLPLFPMLRKKFGMTRLKAKLIYTSDKIKNFHNN